MIKDSTGMFVTVYTETLYTCMQSGFQVKHPNILCHLLFLTDHVTTNSSKYIFVLQIISIFS